MQKQKFTPELYPTAIRSTGVGLASSFGRFGGVISPYVGMSSIFRVFFVIIVIGALVLLIFGKETKNTDSAIPV